MPNDKEQTIIKGLIDSNENVQKEFLKQYYESILRYLFYNKKVKNQHDAEEIINDTFFLAFRGIKKFKKKSSLKTWLFQIANHAVVDFYRSSRNRYSTRSVDENSQIKEPVADTYLSSMQKTLDPASEMLRKETQERIQECLQQLNGEHRMVVTLCLIDECSVKETAQIMGKTEGAIKMLFFRAWRKLINIIEGYPYFIDYQIKKEEVSLNER